MRTRAAASARSTGVYDEAGGVDVRGRFLIDPDGVIQAMEVLTPPVGRNFAELVRQVQAFQHVRKTKGAEATPAGWRPGRPPPWRWARIWWVACGRCGNRTNKGGTCQRGTRPRTQIIPAPLPRAGMILTVEHAGQVTTGQP